MKDLENRFNACKNDFPDFGDVIIMWYAVCGMKYPHDIILKVFNKCVNKDEYDQSEKSELIAYLDRYSMGGDDPYKIRSV